jgi:hypothetical protein|tara:strand:+ start:521 stop:1438 length:918 start_codon:yes stop_codon:yes gene_type:complete
MKMRIRLSFPMLALPVLSLSAAAVAQTPADPGEEAQQGTVISVTGQRQQSQQFVEATEALTPAPSMGDPLPRFLDALCLKVGGAGIGQAAAIKTMIEQHARALDIAIAEEGCTLNAVIVAVADPQNFIDKLLTDQPWLAKADTRARIDRALDQNRPVIAWSNTEVRTVDGRPLQVSSEIGGMSLGDSVPVTRGGPPRRIGLNHSIALANMIVVIDAARLEGASLRQIADFGAMRLLAPTRKSGWEDTLPPSILSLLDSSPAAAPIELTDFDAAYLRALYSLPANVQATQLRSQVLRERKHEMAQR